VAVSKLTLEIRVAWWLRLYLYGVVITSRVTGLEPDWSKVKRMIGRGVTVGRVKPPRRRNAP
jgi:hypothetical protein